MLRGNERIRRSPARPEECGGSDRRVKEGQGTQRGNRGPGGACRRTRDEKWTGTEGPNGANERAGVKKRRAGGWDPELQIRKSMSQSAGPVVFRKPGLREFGGRGMPSTL
jgi:hypothetical protein